MRHPVWTPTAARRSSSNLARFMDGIQARRRLSFGGYSDLHSWSVNNLEDFWREVWDFVGIHSEVTGSETLRSPRAMPGALWFPEARLNFAENLLRHRTGKAALVFYGEDRERRRISYAELYELVACAAAGLRRMGIQPGDRVAAFMPNMPETIIAMLAAVSLGAVWSSCSPDFGFDGVVDRFGQIRPRVLIAATGYYFRGAHLELLDRVSAIVSAIPSIEQTVIVPYAGSGAAASSVRGSIAWDAFTAQSEPTEFVQLPFNHPVYIMYSSGTTGLPKCMVQGTGVLLNHLKELVLHTDVKEDDVLFYYTTCGWMMWNWLASGLATGATLVLFDGSPFHPGPEALWQMAAEERISIFGTSARYLRAVEDAGFAPESLGLGALRTILSTGSPLAPEQFDWVYSRVKADLQLASISGGTDLNGCFALGNPLDPVYRGELQCRGLGMAVEIWNDEGISVRSERGELVCTRPFPSMPLYFWDDSDGSRYRAAYFERFGGKWCHGDYAELTEHDGLIVYGRSDATLNPGGVRIGTADLYSVLESMPEIEDSVVIGQAWKGDERIVLFVKLASGYGLDEALATKIRGLIRSRTSPRHVPAKIVSVPDVPYTLNMKKVEVAVRKTVQGEAVTNKDALRNPECLVHFRDRPELAAD